MDRIIFDWNCPFWGNVGWAYQTYSQHKDGCIIWKWECCWPQFRFVLRKVAKKQNSFRKYWFLFKNDKGCASRIALHCSCEIFWKQDIKFYALYEGEDVRDDGCNIASYLLATAFSRLLIPPPPTLPQRTQSSISCPLQSVTYYGNKLIPCTKLADIK